MRPLLHNSIPFFSRRSMAATALREKIYFFGGVGAVNASESILDVSDDLWCFNTEDLTWTRIPYSTPWPSPRRCVGWISHQGNLLLWGGSGIKGKGNDVNYTFLNDFWRFDPLNKRWNLIQETDDHVETPFNGKQYPFPRYTPVFHSTGQDLFLFGGYTEDRLGKRKLNDVWICRDELWHQIIPKDKRVGYKNGAEWPGIRYGSVSAGQDNFIYICGGFSDEGDHIDLWRFDVSDEKWELISQDEENGKIPHPRYCAAFTLYKNRLFLFGGRSRRNPKLNFNDLWMYDLSEAKWYLINENRIPHRYDSEAEFPGYHAKVATSRVGHHWYICCGEGLHGHVSDFWRFNLNSTFPHGKL